MLRTALIVTAVAVPTSVQAQVGVTISGGAISSQDPSPGGGFVEPAYAISFGGVIKRHLVIEAELSHWSHTLRVDSGPHDIFGPDGRLGSVEGTVVEDSGGLWNFGGNVMLQSTGAVRVFGGGGASLSVEDSNYSQQSFGCSPSLDPRTCTPFVNHRLRGPVPVFRVLGGVDVPLTSHVSIVGSVRAETTAWEDRSRWVTGLGGVRFTF